MKKTSHLTNLWLQGLMMAATISMAFPDLSFAADLAGAVNQSNTQFTGALKLITYGSYTMGGLLTAAGVMALKNHSENPTGMPLGKALGRLGGGLGLIAIPAVAQVLQQTNNSVTGGGNTSFTPIQGVN